MSYFEFSSPSRKSFCILDYFSFNSTFGYLYILCSPTWKHIVDFRKQGKYLLLFSSWVMSNSLWTVARQAPLSIDFPRQEYWSGLPFPPPGNLPDSGIEPESLGRQILYYWHLAGGLFIYFEEGVATSKNWATPNSWVFEGQPWKCHGTCGCVT